MKNKYTILLIPPDHGPAKQIQIPAKGKRVVILAVCLLFVTVGSLALHDFYQAKYIRNHMESFAHIDSLQDTLQKKEEEIQNLNKKSVEMSKNLNAIESLEEQIASILKLQTSSTGFSASRGTGPTPQSYSPSENLEGNAELVQQHFVIMQSYYEAALKHEDKLNHTPSILPLEGEIASYFGYRKNPFGGWSREFHNGIDIACDYATPVHSTADGTVTFAGWDNVYGRKVQVDHGNGVVTFYGHNSRLNVKVGQSVKKGDILAYSGNSGRSTGTHVHYGAIVNGKSVDPLMFTSTTKEQ